LHPTIYQSLGRSLDENWFDPTLPGRYESSDPQHLRESLLAGKRLLAKYNENCAQFRAQLTTKITKGTNKTQILFV
jgi:hypothetical protein